MELVRFVDSAMEPTPAQIKAAVDMGVVGWGFYRNPSPNSAFHNWSDAGVHALAANGISRGWPIMVPLMGSGRIASQTPEADAEAFIADLASLNVHGAGILDTEESMRGDPWTATYTARWGREVRTLGAVDVCYGGGFMPSAPPETTAVIWIEPGATPGAGQAFQVGQLTIAELAADEDLLDETFPFAALGGAMVPTHEHVTLNPLGDTVAWIVPPAGTTDLLSAVPWEILDGPDVKITVDVFAAAPAGVPAGAVPVRVQGPPNGPVDFNAVWGTTSPGSTVG